MSWGVYHINTSRASSSFWIAVYSYYILLYEYTRTYLSVKVEIFENTKKKTHKKSYNIDSSIFSHIYFNIFMIYFKIKDSFFRANHCPQNWKDR